MSSQIKEIEELLAQVPAPEPNLEFESNPPHRKFYKVNYLSDGYSERQEQVECKREEADVVASLTVDGLHAPAIDIDLPCRLEPSGTQGHFHLYIDKPMTFKNYLKLLKVMAEVGIVEEGYYKMTKTRGASYLRTPEKPKPVSKVKYNPNGGYW